MAQTRETSSVDAAASALGTGAGAHAELLTRHRAVTPAWISLLYEDPIELVNGEGRYVWDGEGRRYLDFFGGILVTIAGHDVPEIVDAIKVQADAILHTSTLYMIRPAVELAEKIAALVPIPDAKVFFCNSGSEANDAALLLASTYRRSNTILSLRNSYHGRLFSTLSVTGNRNWGATSHAPLNVSWVHPGDALRGVLADVAPERRVEACVADLREVIDTTTAGPIAALIAEPVQGVAGYHVPPAGLLRAYKEVLDEHDALFISDEVQTGWGRTGDTFWGIDAHGVTPDIITFAKGLGNGLAIGGVVARAEVMDAVDVHSISTFGGNPLATAGAAANIDYLLDNDLQANAAAIGAHMRSRLDVLNAEHAGVDVRGKGLMLALEFTAPAPSDPARPDVETAHTVLEHCKSAGLLLGLGGLHGNCVRIAPPLSVTRDESDAACDIIEDAVRTAVRE